MGKADLIERYGEAWYEEHKRKMRLRAKAIYDQDPKAACAKRNARRNANKEYVKQYNREHRDVYRINCRDRNRLILMGYDLTGKVLHHLKYHADNSDASWLDDVVLMTRAEHAKWHSEHPEFVTSENVV